MITRTPLFGMQLDPVRLDEAVEQVLAWAEDKDGPCKYVVTPNVDHAVMFQQNEALRQAYAGASLVLADGAPVVFASRLLGRPLPERVAGSDLAPALFEENERRERPSSVFLLGAAPGVAARAAQNMAERWPRTPVVGVYSPPFGFEKSEKENAAILEAIRVTNPDIVLVGLGAPKQELWVARHHKQLAARVALCVGASIDFLAGVRPRAPRWMCNSGLEWLHRLANEPRRLAGRYARDALIFPRLLWREWRSAWPPRVL